MTYLFHDFETRSAGDLLGEGGYKYAMHPTTEILMCAYAFDDGPIQQWQPVIGEPMPNDLESALFDPSVFKCAWNASFERLIWRHCWDTEIPIEQWRDTAVLARSLSFPGALNNACTALRAPPDFRKHDKLGKKYIQRYSVPDTRKGAKQMFRCWSEDETAWNEFLFYNRMDVEAERWIHNHLKDFDLPEEEWHVWHIDQHINDAGVPINVDVVRNAIAIRDEIHSEKMISLKEWTGLENPNSNQQFLAWAREHGYQYGDLQAATIQTELACEGDGRPPELYAALKLKADVAGVANKKFDALLKWVCPDGRVRGTLYYAGAHTLRWSGKGPQLQNRKKPKKGFDGLKWKETPLGNKWCIGGTQTEVAVYLKFLTPAGFQMLYDEELDVLSTAVNTCIEAEEGKVYVDADFASIENAVLAWMTEDPNLLEVYKNGLDPYIAFACYLFNMTYEEILAEVKAGDKSKRNMGKIPTLACGYDMGPGRTVWDEKKNAYVKTGMMFVADGYGMDLTQSESKWMVDTWKKTYKGVPKYWELIEGAARETVTTGRVTYAGPVCFDYKGGFLRMGLPSGRCLHYFGAKWDWRQTPWGKQKQMLVYGGRQGSRWAEVQTRGGKLTENADQAIARDLLKEALVKCHAEGLEVVLHVHDQIVVLADEGKADETLTRLVQIMEDKPDWARGIPVRADAHISPWLVKD